MDYKQVEKARFNDYCNLIKLVHGEKFTKEWQKLARAYATVGTPFKTQLKEISKLIGR